jgi:threonine/homoserine/homoserine lactone efflux protein
MRHVLDLVVLGAVWFVVVVAPGPNFLASVSAATTRGRRHGVRVAAGFALGDAIWAASSVLGLAVLLARYGWLAEVVRFGGAAVLLVLGARSVLRSRHGFVPVREGAAPPARRLRSGLLTGLLVDLGNPKAAVFFTSLFAALLPATAPWWEALAAVAVVSAIAGGWYSLVVWLFCTGRVAAAYRRLRRPIDAVAGALFIGLGIRMVATG